MQSELQTEKSKRKMKSIDLLGGGEGGDSQQRHTSAATTKSHHHQNSKSSKHENNKKLKTSSAVLIKKPDSNSKVISSSSNSTNDVDAQLSDNETKDEKTMLNKLYKASALNSLQHLKAIKLEEQLSNGNEAPTIEPISEIKLVEKRRSTSKENTGNSTQIKSKKSRSRSITKNRNSKSYKRSVSSSISRSRSSSYSSRRSTSRSASRSQSSYSSRSSRRSSSAYSRESRRSSSRSDRSQSRSRTRSRSDTRSRSSSRSRRMSSRSDRSSYSRRSSRSRRSSSSSSRSKRSYTLSSRSSSRRTRSSSYSSRSSSTKNYKSRRSTSRKRPQRTHGRRRSDRRRRHTTSSSSRSRSSDNKSNKHANKHDLAPKYAANKSVSHAKLASNPTSALPFPSTFNAKRNNANQHLSKHLTKDNKYSFNKNSKPNTKTSQSQSNLNLIQQQQFQLTSANNNNNNSINNGTTSFLNRNKNPAFSYMNGHQARFNFYNNTNLVNRTNLTTNSTGTTTTTTATANDLITNRNSPVIFQSQLQQQQVNGVKTAKLSTVNLNNKAREELLEKRKLKAQSEQSNENNQTVEQKSEPPPAEQENEEEEKETNSKSVDNTPAIPITSYTSINDDDDDEEEEDEEEEDKKYETAEASLLKKTFSIDLKKRKSDVLKVDKQTANTNVKKAKSNTEDLNSDEDDEESSYFNVFKSTSNSETSIAAITTSKTKLKVNVNKMKLPVKKQPIIKAGQTQKDRDEIHTSFIGPKLPDNFEKPANKIDSPKPVVSSKLVKETPTRTVETPVSPTSAEVTSGKTSPSSTSKQPEGPKLNYTKDELAKYNDLSKMSQLYAKINQVGVLNFGPNGVTEINMVELDQQSILMNQAKLEHQQSLIDSSFNLIDLNQINQMEQQSANCEKQLLEQQQLEVNSYSIAADPNHQLQQFSLQTYQTEPQVNVELAEKQGVEKAIALQLNELEGLSAPKDVTIVAQQTAAASATAVTSLSPTNQLQTRVSTTPKETSPKPIINLSSATAAAAGVVPGSQPLITQSILQSTSLATSSTPQTVLLSANRLPYQPIQPIQILSLQNPNLIQYTNPTPVQQLINLQQLQLNNHSQFLPTSLDGFGLNASLLSNSSLIRTQLAAQQHHQQSALEALMHQQQTNPQGIPVQAYAPLQYVPTLAGATATGAPHPQFIQIRPANAFHQASLPPQQPQFIINTPFYRILPQ